MFASSRRSRVWGAIAGLWRAYLLHDASLSLREGDVATRLVLDELDINLSSFATGLVIVIVIIVAGGGADPRALDAAILGGLAAIAGVEGIVDSRGRLRVVGFGDFAHDVDGFDDSSKYHAQYLKEVWAVIGGGSARGLLL